MKRRDLLRVILAAAVSPRFGSSSLTPPRFLLKFVDSDTAAFPFRMRWWGYVDASGQVLIPADSSHISDRFSDFYGGLCAVQYDNGSRWMIDTGGNKHFQIFPDSADWNYVLRDGLIPNRDARSNRWGYVNSGGDWMIHPSFDFAFPFSEKRAVVTVGPHRGVIDIHGRWILQPYLN